MNWQGSIFRVFLSPEKSQWHASLVIKCSSRTDQKSEKMTKNQKGFCRISHCFNIPRKEVSFCLIQRSVDFNSVWSCPWWAIKPFSYWKWKHVMYVKLPVDEINLIDSLSLIKIEAKVVTSCVTSVIAHWWQGWLCCYLSSSPFPFSCLWLYDRPFLVPGLDCFLSRFNSLNGIKLALFFLG